ncbi:MAG TPA: zinc ribbon domain-containing protein [Thermoplasmata archaeon]|nr:zinc ribbon domain-containing protein [Thermoplasmata archaeon]
MTGHRPRRWSLLALVPLLAVLVLPTGSAAYVPGAGDSLSYRETQVLSNGIGNYTGYTENSDYNGSISITSVLANRTESATYQSAGTYRTNTGVSRPWSESGAFTFSAATYHYVQGTDNQSGYTDPYVWFLIDDSLATGASFYLLDTAMKVVSTDEPFALASSPTGYAKAIFAEGNGSYQRNDAYGKFTADYQWKAYFDPSTGYVLGYVLSEQDRDAAGDGFQWTDTLTDSRTSFAVTSAPAPPPSSGGSFGADFVVLAAVALVILIVVVVIAVLVARRSKGARGGTTLPRHAEGASTGVLPTYAPPPPIHLAPGDQPMVQQVVLRETVKVPCRYCGTLIDSTATVCPKCGAPRT